MMILGINFAVSMRRGIRARGRGNPVAIGPHQTIGRGRPLTMWFAIQFTSGR